MWQLRTSGWIVFALSTCFPVFAAFGALGFTDITTPAGVPGPSHYGGHGIMWADVTGDDRPDFYVTMISGPPMAELFYRNIDGVTFTEAAAVRCIDDHDGGSHGGVWGDLDNDGDYDLLNGATGCDRNRVFENNGTGSFTDRTNDSGILNKPYGTRGQVIFDFDGDGDLDIFCNNWGADAELNEFYSNNGGFSFTSIDNGLRNIGGVQGCTEGDFDNDGDLDLLVCKGFGNDGPLMVMQNTGGNFLNVTDSVGLASSGTGQQGATFCDVNKDGWLDIHVQRNSNDSQLYRNNGNGTFTQVPVPNGPGFMAGFDDLDNDGDWDLVYPGDNKVYLNNGSGNFTASSTFSVGKINDPRAVAFADIDNDGDMDFFYAQKAIYNRLIRNDLTGGGNWLKIQLISSSGQAGAFGAKVKTYEPGHAGKSASMISFREARSQEGYLGQNDPVLHFGLGSRSTVDVQVTFLNGTVITRDNVAANQKIVVDARRSERVDWNTLGSITTISRGQMPAVATDSLGNIHVIYLSGGAVQYKKYDSTLTPIVTETITSPSGGAYWPHIMCDSNAIPHMVFTESVNPKLPYVAYCYYTNRIGGSWKTPITAIIAGTDNSIWCPRLALWGSYAYIGCQYGYNPELIGRIDRITNLSGTPTVDASVNTATRSCIAVNGLGQIFAPGRHNGAGTYCQEYDSNLSPVGALQRLMTGYPGSPQTAWADTNNVVHFVAWGVQASGEFPCNDRCGMNYNNTARRNPDSSFQNCIQGLLAGPAGSGPDGDEPSGFWNDDVAPVITVDASNTVYVAWRGWTATGEGRITKVDNSEFTQICTPEPNCGDDICTGTQFCPTITRRRWRNCEIAPTLNGGVYVVWEDAGTVYIRPVGVEPVNMIGASIDLGNPDIFGIASGVAAYTNGTILGFTNP